MDLAPTPSLPDLNSSNEQSNERNARLQRLKAGMDAAKTILCRYPDYGKAPPEYLASIAELLADIPPENLKVMVDKYIGISARCKYLPTHADFVEFDEKLEARRFATRDLRQGRVPEPVKNQKPMPFPKLWEAFKDEPHLLQTNFDQLFEASRRLATDGKDAARDVLARRVGA
jgi:hypothetical protein